MNITREDIKETLRQIMSEESDYQKFFRKALEKAGKSIPSMSDEEKKEFFNKIDKAWNGKGEKKNEGNAFGAAVVAAKEKGEDEFEVDGKTYKVESVNEGNIKLPSSAKKFWNTPLEKLVKTYGSDLRNSIPPSQWNTHPEIIDGYGQNAGPDIFKQLVRDYLMSNDRLDPKLAKMIGIPTDVSIIDYLNDGGSGLNGNKYFKKYDSWFSALYDIYEEMEKKFGKMKPKQVGESVNERLSNSEMKRMDGLHSYKKMEDALKTLTFIGKELYEEGFEKPEILEFILHKVNRRLHLQIRESVTEGRAFVQAARKAKEEGKTEFEFNGKTYPVTLKEEAINERRLGKVDLLRSVEDGETSRVEGVKLSKDLAFELRMFLQRPLLARTRTGIAIDNAQMKDAIPMLAKVGVHKRLSSGVKNEFADLLKKYK